MLGRISDDVRDDPHRWCRRIDIGVPHHELFENVILDRACKFVLRDALLFCGDYIEGQTRNNRPVHRHRNRHGIERDTIKQDLHILDAVNRNASLANIADYTGMVAVIAAMGGEIESHRQTFLARRQIATIESVGFFCG